MSAPVDETGRRGRDRRARTRWCQVGAFCLLFAALAAATGCSSDEERRAEHEARAEEYLAEGKPNEALLELRNALRLAPQSSDLNFRIATILYERQKLVDSAFFFSEAARLDPERTDAPLRQALIEVHRDQDLAEELIDGVLAREPGNAGAYLARSQLLLFREDTQGALQAALTALEFEPDNIACLQQLGKVHQARIREAQIHGGRADDEVFEAAIDAFTRGAEIDDPVARVQVWAEVAKVQMAWPGHGDEAEATFRRVLDDVEYVSPAARNTVIRDIVSFARQTRRDELLGEALEVWVATSPSSQSAWTNLARYEKQETGSVEGVLERLRTTRADDPQAALAYSAILVEDGRPGEAVDHLVAQADLGIEPAGMLRAAATILASSRRHRDRLPEVVERMEREYPGEDGTVLARAQLDMVEGRPDEAAKALRDLTGRSDLQPVWFQLALAEYQRGDRAAALGAVGHAVELAEGGPMPLRALWLRARLEVELGDCTAGLRTLALLSRRGMNLMPPQRLMQASCLYELRRPRAARALLDELLEMRDPFPPAVLEYARREGTAHPEKARAALERAVEAAPTDARLQASLALLDAQQGRDAEALTRLNELVASGRANPEIVFLRARLLARRGDWAAAQRDALQAFEASPETPGLAAFLVQTYQAQGDETAAIASFEEADAAGALGVPARYLLARLHLLAGSQERGRELLEQVVAADESLGMARNDLAYQLAQQGQDLDRALELAREAQRLVGDRAQIADTLGYVYLKRGLNEPAAQQFRRALELGDPEAADMAVVHHHLGLALRGLGESDAAANEFEQALALDAGLEDAARELESLRGEAEVQGAAPASS